MKIQEIPFFLKPFFNLYGFVIGELVNFYYTFARNTCKIKIINEERLKRHAVFCLWHGNLNFFFTHTKSLKGQAWLNHPFVYMMPYYYLLKRLGCEHISLGSTGASGKEAAEDLLVHLKKGLSTLVAVDGPVGPRFEPRSGAFYLALGAKIPILPMKYSYRRCLRIPTWDRKTFMIPFLSELTVEILDDIHVSHRENIPNYKKSLQEIL